MIIGTFFESYSGPDFANRLVYKNWPFIFIQGLTLTSICFAAFLRLPPKKRLYGFYTIHTGLVLVGLGALITYLCGIDGSIFLPLNESARTVVLKDDILNIHLKSEGKVVSYKLPYTPFPKKLHAQTEGLGLGRYYPFAESVFSWQDARKVDSISTSVHSSRYLLESTNATEEFLLSLHPESVDFKSSLSLGPLTIHYLPEGLASCFTRPSPSGHLIWNGDLQRCFTPEDEEVSFSQTKSGKRFLVIQSGGELMTFFPDLSPWPLDRDMNPVMEGPWRGFSKTIFQGKPTLFLFGKSLSYYDKEKKSWGVYPLVEKGPHIPLPWMGFTLQLLEHSAHRVPALVPTPVSIPIYKDDRFVRGGLRALEVIVGKERFWATDRRPLSVLVDGKEIIFSLQKDALTLPYELVLSRFKMDTDPGTENPSSYESFVSLFTEDGPQDAHIFMNNPLEYRGMTFYQASYSRDERGLYASTLSVNIDQGRPLKYLGSLLVVIGAILHYRLQRRKRMA